MSAPPTYREVTRLNHAGQYEEALHLLDTEPDTGIHLWQRGWALHHLGRTEEAHSALERAERLLTGTNLGRMRLERAVLYGHERRFARAYDLHLQAWQILRTDPVCHALSLYNLGWQHLSRLQLGQARRWLSEALAVGEAAVGEGALERMVTRMGVSTLERLSGNTEEALRRARWAQEVAQGHRLAYMPLRAAGQAYRHLGQWEEARGALLEAVERAPEGPYRVSDQLLLGLLHRQMGQEVDLESLRAGAMPLDTVRLDLHLADEARLAGREAEALARLRAVVELDEPYPLQDEAPTLRDLYSWGRAAGLSLPDLAASSSVRRLELQVLGVPSLRVGDVEIPVQVGRALALLTYIVMYGQTTLRALHDDVFSGTAPEQLRTRVRAAITQVNRWVGQPELLKLQGQLVIPQPGWTLHADISDVLAGEGRAQGAFLPGFYSTWTSRLQDHLDHHGRPAES